MFREDKQQTTSRFNFLQFSGHTMTKHSSRKKQMLARKKRIAMKEKKTLILRSLVGRTIRVYMCIRPCPCEMDSKIVKGRNDVRRKR